MRVFRGFPNGVAAIFEEASGGGDFTDINAARNAPAKNPSAHLDKVTWHSDFFQYEVAVGPVSKKVTHTALEGRTLWYSVSGGDGFVGGSTTPPTSGIAFKVMGQYRTQNITLVEHNLGYVPLFMIAFQGHSLPVGMTIQKQSGSRGRIVSAYATSSVIGLREVAWSSNQALAPIDRTYEVQVFRTPDEVNGRKVVEMDGTRLLLGRGKVDTSKKYLRRVKAGESSFDIDRAPTTDWKNGGVRVVTGGQTIDDATYNGSFAGPAFIPVGV